MIKIIGLDIAKNVFQVHGVDETGQPALRRKLRRAEVLRLFYHLEPALVGIEACHTAHHWAREISWSARMASMRRANSGNAVPSATSSSISRSMLRILWPTTTPNSAKCASLRADSTAGPSH